MASLLIELHLRPEQLLDYYRGEARSVVTLAANGQTVQFPASALQKHVTLDGIHGWFRIEFDAAHKFIRLERAPAGPGLDHFA